MSKTINKKLEVMKKKLNKSIFGGALLMAIAGMGLTSCSSDFLDTNPTDRVGTDEVWSTYNMANDVVNGVYKRFYYENGKECPDWQDWDCATEVADLDANWSGYAWARGRANASWWGFSDLWKRYYEEIYRADNVIVNLNQCTAMSESERARDIAECKFLRAWAYYRANVLWRGVPIYLEPVEYGQDTKARNTEDEVWEQIIQDCTDAINEPNLPNKYSTSDQNYGRVTKAAAYYLRGQVYLWKKQWANAEADFREITTMGFQLFPDYKNMFKAANEKNDEYIFQYEYSDDVGLGSLLGRSHGNRVTYTADGFGCWNNIIPNPYFVDSYQYANGKPFDMDEVIPGYSKMNPKARSVYFLRNGLDPNSSDARLKAGYQQMVEYGSDMSKYDKDGNEERILKVYKDRDPRMLMNFITPYSTYQGGATADCWNYTLRWPYIGSDNAAPYDLRSDTNDRFYYLFRKYVPEGREVKDGLNSSIDTPIFRYAGALLSLAGALNEQGKTDEAVQYVNQVRGRIPGLALLNSNEWTTVKGQDDMRTRLMNEYKWELCGEGQLYWKEQRWGTWLDTKLGTNRTTVTDPAQMNGANGMTEIWGTKRYTNNYIGEYVNVFAIPESEIERNPNLTQNPGW